MILRSLRVHSFRSYATASIVFGEAQNYVVGNNWQGKSTLVEAVVFALFGSDAFPRRVAGSPVKMDHLVMDGASSGHVELAFQVGEHEYSVRRALPRSTVSLSCDGELVASGKRPVDEKLRDLLAVDVKFFGNVFYADQDELRKSFDLTPKDRRDFIERLIGQEVWRERIEGLRKAAKHLEQFVTDLRSGKFGVFVDELDRLGEENAEAERELADLDLQIKTLKKGLPKDRNELTRQQTRVGKPIVDGAHRRTTLLAEKGFKEELARGLTKGTCPTCKQAVAPAVRRSCLADLRRQMKAIDVELGRLAKELEVLHAAYDDEFGDASERFDDLRDVETRRDVLAREQQKRVAREKDLRKQAGVYGKKPDHYRRAHDESAFLRRLVEIIEEHRSALRGRVVGELVTAMNDLLARFHDGDFDAEAVIGSDLDLHVKLHGREAPLTNLSGAAKDMFAIALRYGLMRIAARHVDCLILDEPTRHMDPRNVRQLKAVFDDLDDRQLLVVTVQEEFADARGRHFAVAKDERLRSIVTAS